MNTLRQGISVIFLLIILLGCSQEQAPEWIPFTWEGDTIAGNYIEKAYIYVPVKIEDLPEEFTMQLDLGTHQTLFYGNTIQPYLDEYASLSEKYNAPWFKDITLQLGSVDFKGVDIGYMNNFGDTSKHIGTIAPDMFQDKILMIDYKSARFAVADSLPDEYKDLPAEKFELEDGLIMLPFRINGKACKLLFDTGSSPFRLATSKERALEIAAPQITDSLSGPLWWGNEITFYGMEINKPVEFAGKTLTAGKVYYDNVGLWEEQVFHPLNIWGLTGNAYFFDNTVIIDYRNKLFRVK